MKRGLEKNGRVVPEDGGDGEGRGSTRWFQVLLPDEEGDDEERDGRDSRGREEMVTRWMAKAESAEIGLT